MSMKRTIRGFTLVELLIAIVVIAILASISISAYNGIQDRAEAARMGAIAREYETLLKLYAVDKGHFPVIEDDFESGIANRGMACLGHQSDYPSTSIYPAGVCMIDTDPAYPNNILGTSTQLHSALLAYGRPPSGRSNQITENGPMRYRGIEYSSPRMRGANIDQHATLRWFVKGNQVNNCGPKSLPGYGAQYWSWVNQTECWLRISSQ